MIQFTLAWAIFDTSYSFIVLILCHSKSSCKQLSGVIQDDGGNNPKWSNNSHIWYQDSNHKGL